MTNKHMNKLASLVRAWHERWGYFSAVQLANDFASDCESLGNFDRARFFRTCGLE